MRLATEEPGWPTSGLGSRSRTWQLRAYAAERCNALILQQVACGREVSRWPFSAISRADGPFARTRQRAAASWSRDRPAGPSLSCCRGCSPAAVLDCVSWRLAEIDGHPAVIFPALSRSGGYLAEASEWDHGHRSAK